MNAKGRTIVLGLFGVGLAMAFGGWWFRYQASRRAAAFWGAPGARLVVGESNVELLVLGEPAPAAESGQAVAGRPVTDAFDLTERRGLVHLRYALTQDANFSWDELQREPDSGGPEWRYALRFALGDERLVVLFSEDFGQLGKVDGEQVDVLPCPLLGPVIERYLRDVGAPLGKSGQ